MSGTSRSVKKTQVSDKAIPHIASPVWISLTARESLAFEVPVVTFSGENRQRGLWPTRS